jgi:hypothetical protein
MSQANLSEDAVHHMTGRSHSEGMRWRVLASIIGPIAWLSFTLLYVGFWAQGYSLFQSVIVILVSLLILGGVMGVLWVTWGMDGRGWAERWHD